MKVKFLLLLATFLAVAVLLPAQTWMKDVPANDDGRMNYFEAKKYIGNFRKMNPHRKLSEEKQFLRAQFLLDGRVDETGRLPVGTYWEEAMKAIKQRKETKDGLNQWMPLGPNSVPINVAAGRIGGIGRIDCIEFHPDNGDIFYIGSPSGGAWKTIDGGASWESLTDNIPSIGISDIDLMPGDPETIFICTGTRDTWWETFSVGILRSDDGGYTWQETGLNYAITQNRAVHELLINPENPLIMVAATSGGIYRSIDGGDYWDYVQGGNFMDLEFKSGDYNVVFATTFTYYNCNGKIYRSVDGGQNFDALENTGIIPSQVNRITIGVTPADPEVIYALCSSCSDNGFHGLYRSNDGGDTWYETENADNKNLLGWASSGTDNGGQGYYTLALAVAPNNPNLVYVGGVNIWRSNNAGENWTLDAQWQGQGAVYVHADIHIFKYNNNTLFNGNDGGIYKFVPLNNNWVDLSEGLEIMQLYRLGVYRNDETLRIASPQDNGTILFREGGFNEIVLAEACDNFFHYDNPDVMFFGGYGAGLRRSVNGGGSSVSIQPPGETNLRFNPPFIMHPEDTQILYCGFLDVWKSENTGTSWTNLTNGLSNGVYYNSLEVAPSDDNYIYAATSQQIWRSTDDGVTWENIKAGLLTNTAISDIVISSADPKHIWVTMSGFSLNRKVYHSVDAGDNWENISINLPNLPVNCIAYEPGLDDAIYVGTDVGVYYLNNNHDEWICYSDGLPNVMIDELEIHPVSGKIFAATFGRGIWDCPLADPIYVSVENNGISGLNVYPNPSENDLWIEFSGVENEIFTISVINLLGQTVAEKTITSDNGTVKLQFDVAELPRGLYTVQVLGHDTEQVRKVVLE